MQSDLHFSAVAAVVGVGVHLGATCACVLRIHALILFHASQRISENRMESGAALRNRETLSRLSVRRPSDPLLEFRFAHSYTDLGRSAPHRSGQGARLEATARVGAGFPQVLALLFLSGSKVSLGNEVRNIYELFLLLRYSSLRNSNI